MNRAIRLPARGILRRGGALLFGLAANDSLFLVCAKLGFKACLFVFIFTMARHLDQDEFGDFQFVSSIVNVLTQPTVFFSMLATHIAFSFPLETRLGNIRWFYARGRGLWALFAAATLAILALLDTMLARIASISTPWSLAVASMIVVSAVAFNYFIGYLQAMERFKTVGLAFLGMGIVTAVLGWFVFGLDLDIRFAYGSQALANFIAMGGVLAALHYHLLAHDRVPVDIQRFPTAKYGAKAFLAVTIFFLLLNMDIFAVKLGFDRSTAGYYLRIEFLAKIFFVAASSMAVVLLSLAFKSRSSTGGPFRLLVRGGAVFGVLSLVLIVVVATFADTIFQFVYGEASIIDTELLVLVLAARLLQSYIFLLINYGGPSICRWMIFVLLLPVGLQAGLLLALPASLVNVGWAIFLSSAIGVIGIATYTRIKRFVPAAADGSYG